MVSINKLKIIKIFYFLNIPRYLFQFMQIWRKWNEDVLESSKTVTGSYLHIRNSKEVIEMTEKKYKICRHIYLGEECSEK